MTNIGFMVSVKITVLLLVMNWVHLCSTLNDECLRDMDDGQDLSVIPVEITCTTFLNGTLNTWWTVGDYVELVTLDYNCTGFGEGDLAENLRLWVPGSRGQTIADHVDLRPNASSDSFNTDPTCYVDGCFVWNSGRDNDLTWIIPTITCHLPTTLQTTSLDWSSSVVTVTSVTTTTTVPTDATLPQPISGGLKSYIWLMLILVPILATVLCMPFLILWRVKRRQRQGWLYGNNRDTKLLLGDEPCIDPMGRVKNDYFETITIIDPLDLPEQVQPGLGMTTIVPVDNHFIQDFNQQAGDSDSHSFNESSSSGNEDVSIPVGSASGGDAENDSSSACTQSMENGEDTGAQQSDSEEERMVTSNPSANIMGTSAHVRPTSLNLQKNCPPFTKRDNSNQTQISNQVASPTKPAKVVTTSTSICERSGGSASSLDKISCTLIDDVQKKLSCTESSPEHSGMSMYGELASAHARPTSSDLRKQCPSSTERDELSHPNQIVNTKGASAHARPTTLYLRKLCLPSTERDELSHPSQIVINSNTKGASARTRPTTLYLRKLCPPSTEKDKLSHPTIYSNTKGASVPTILNLQKLCPSSTKKDELSHSNQIQMSTEVASHPGPAKLVIMSTSINRRSGESASIHLASANSTDQSVSLEVDSSPVTEQVYKNVNSEESDHHSHLESHDHTREIKQKEHRQYTSAAVRSSKHGALYTIPEEDQTRYQSSPSYISSSECTSSVYSSAQGANCGVGYLADIEDMDSASMQLNLDSDEGAGDEVYVVHVEGENRSQLERLEQLIQWYNKNRRQSHNLLSQESDDDFEYLYIATVPEIELPDSPCSRYIGTLPPRVLSGESDDDFEYLYIATVPEIELPDSPCSKNIGTLPIRVLSGESDDDFEYLYIATVPEIELPDSPCNKNIGTLPPRVELHQDDEDTFGLADEDTAQPLEHTDTPNSGYVPSDPQNEIRDGVQQYQHETTV